MWKENILEDLEVGELEYAMAGEFLAEIKREFGEENKKTVKVAKLRRMEQRGKTMEEFVQEFRKAARGSGCEGCLLIEEFKKGMNSTIRKRLMEAEKQLASIEQWYERAINLDRNWRESRKDKEKLRGRRDTGLQALRHNDNKCHDLKCGQESRKCLNSR